MSRKASKPTVRKLKSNTERVDRRNQRAHPLREHSDRTLGEHSDGTTPPAHQREQAPLLTSHQGVTAESKRQRMDGKGGPVSPPHHWDAQGRGKKTWPWASPHGLQRPSGSLLQSHEGKVRREESKYEQGTKTDV